MLSDPLDFYKETLELGILVHCIEKQYLQVKAWVFNVDFMLSRTHPYSDVCVGGGERQRERDSVSVSIR